MKAGRKEVSRLSFFLLRSSSGHFGARAASDQGGVSWVMSRCKREKASPPLKKVDTGAFAGLEAWWRFHFWLLSVACGEDSGPSCAPWSLCLERSLGCLPCPAQFYTRSLEKDQNADGCGRGQRSEEKLLLSSRRSPLPPHRNTPYCNVSLGGPVRGQGSGILYQGCSEHILFFKRTMFVNFMYTGKLLKMYLIL